MQELYDLDDIVKVFKHEYTAFKEKGNKSAGTRARKALSDLAAYAKEQRKAIQDAKNNPEPTV